MGRNGDETSRSGENYGGFLERPGIRPYPFADAMLVKVPDGVEPAAVASVSDNVPDAWRGVARQLAAEPGAPVLICGGAGSIALYAVQIAMRARVASASTSRAGGPEHRERADPVCGANLLDEEFPDWAGPLPDHHGLQRHPRGPLLRAAVHRARRPLHHQRDLLRAEDAGAAAGDVHERDQRLHRPRSLRPVMEPILELVAEGKLKPEEITGETAEWDDAAEAVANHRSKLVITR